ncbi:MAG: enoyl-CoA hydratase/isomerase family protein [Novosphingobium sp.]
MSEGNIAWVQPARFWPGESRYDGAVACIDLDRADAGPVVPSLPPCPVIGVGDSAHPFARHCDVLIEPPFTLEALLAQVAAKPMAAGVLVQLLRQLPGLEVEQALVTESLAYGLLQGSAEHRAWLAGRPETMAGEAGAVVLCRTDHRLEVTLDRAAHGNAIDRAMRDALREALALAALDTDLTVVHLRARGRAFSLGADLAEFGTTSDPAVAHTIRTRTLPAYMAAHCAPKLTAHVQGACVGAGLELAAWAHCLTASANAWFQLPELAMGILPGAGGCVSLTRRIGRQRTALLALSGKRISARQALALGLVDAIVDAAPADEGGTHIS